MKRVIAGIAALTLLATGAAAVDLDSECLDCHRPGQSRGAVPLIEGQQQDFVRHQLIRFRERHRDEFPMSALAAGFDDAEIARIARLLEARPWRSAPGAADREAAAAGRTRAGQLACASCHGRDYTGIGDIPRLAGQDPVYLSAELAKFGSGERYHPTSGIGVRLYVLTDADRNAIAAFLHGLPAAAGSGEPPR